LPPIGNELRVWDIIEILRFLSRRLQRNHLQAFAFANQFKGGVAGNAQQPGGKAGFPSKTIESLQRAQKCLLRHILGILLLPQHPHRQGIDPLFMAGGQHLKGIQVACLRALHQFNIGGFGRNRSRHVRLTI
jgi:hypothetical protein